MSSFIVGITFYDSIFGFFNRRNLFENWTFLSFAIQCCLINWALEQVVFLKSLITKANRKISPTYNPFLSGLSGPGRSLLYSWHMQKLTPPLTALNVKLFLDKNSIPVGKNICQRRDSNSRTHSVPETSFLSSRTLYVKLSLESGALDHSATLTPNKFRAIIS
jgi:hypothetical protein